MSTSIENRIVNMQFKNTGFQKGVKSTLDSLGQLRKGLELKGASSGLADVQGSVSKFSVAGMLQQLKGAEAGFAALATVGITALANLTNKAVDAGVQLGNALFLDSKKAGFDEYELKMGSIQTIMAGTGEELDVVNEKLNELNKYSDDTIYSFQDMTSNIGKFTNAGVDLDTAVNSIQGISNAAALAGANSGEASRAMYNFSQAISAGHVKLIDWKSIELANMATAEFKTELLESGVAAGTLTKDVDGMYKTLEGTPVSATKGFNESLQEQWLTTEALNDTLGRYSDETTEIGKKAFAAAKDIKTGSMLLDTWKEAAASSWAESFEYVIGDFEEAKQLWTGIDKAVGPLLQASDKRRNRMLKGWKEGGGRDAVVEGVQNLWKTLSSIMGPISRAWNTIFPPSTGGLLLSISKGFLRLTEGFKIGAVLSRTIGRAFEFVFSIVKAGIGILKGAAGLFTNIFASIGKAFASVEIGSGFRELFMIVNDLVKAFLKWMDVGPRIDAFFSMLRKYQTSVIVPMVAFVDKLALALAKLLQGDMSGVRTALADAFSNLDGPLDTVRQIFSDLFSSMNGGIDNFIDKLKSIGGDALAPVIAALTWVRDRISEIQKSLGSFKIDFDLGGLGKGASDGANGLAGAGEKAASIWERVKGVLKSVADVIGPVTERISQFFATMADKTLSWVEDMDMAEAVSLLNTGFFIAAYLAFKKFLDKLSGLTDGLKDFTKKGSEAFGQLTDTLKTMQTEVKAKILLTIALAVGVLVAALILLATVDSDKLIPALIGIGVLLALVTATLFAITKMDLSGGGTIKAAATLILLAISINLLAAAVTKIAKLSWSEMARGLAGTAALLVALAIFTKIASTGGGGIKAGAGLILMAIAINLLVVAVSKLGNMDTKTLQKGLITLGIIIVMFGALAVALSQDGILKGAAGLVLLSVSLFLMYGAIKLFAGMDWAEFGKGMLLIAGTLAILIAAIRLMPGDGGLKGAAAIIIVAAAMLVMAGVLKVFASMGWDDILKAGVVLAGTLALIVAAVILVEGALPGAGALVVVAAALLILSISLIVLSGMSWEGVLVALVALAGVFVVLGLAAVVLGPLIPVLLLLAVAIGALGLAMVLAGLGFLAFATGFSIIAAVGVAGVAVLVAAFEGLIMLIPLFMEQIGLGFIAFAKVISDAGPVLVAALTTVLMALLDSIREVVPEAVSVLGALILALVAEARRLLPQITEQVLIMLLDFLGKMNTYMPQIVAAMYSIMIGILAEMRTYIPEVVNAVADMMVDFLNAISDRLGDIIDAGADLIIGFLDGIERKIPVIIYKARRVVRTFIDNMATAIEEDIPWIVGRIVSMGGNMIDGLIEALGDGVRRVKDAAINVVKSGWDAAMGWLGIKSPSRKFMEMGYWSVMGVSKGLDDNTKSVVKSSENLGSAAYDTLKSSLSAISSVLDGELDLTPVIAPVVDMTDIDKMTKTLGSVQSPKLELDLRRSSRRAEEVRRKWGLGRPSDLSPIDNPYATEPSKTEINYVQNNNSPKALSQAEIYRQTKNQLSAIKKEVGI